MFAGVFLASTFAVTAAVWPMRDQAVVDGINAPACQPVLAGGASSADECAALRAFLEHEKISLASVDEYDSYRRSKGLKWAGIFLAVWAGFVGSFYVLGWAGVKVARSIPDLRRRRGA